MLSQGGAMTNPFEFREVMMASVGYDERSPEEVIAQQKQRHEAAAAKRKGPTKRGPKGAPPAAPELTDFNAVPKAALAELDRLRTLAAAKS